MIAFSSDEKDKVIPDVAAKPSEEDSLAADSFDVPQAPSSHYQVDEERQLTIDEESAVVMPARCKTQTSEDAMPLHYETDEVSSNPAPKGRLAWTVGNKSYSYIGVEFDDRTCSQSHSHDSSVASKSWEKTGGSSHNESEPNKRKYGVLFRIAMVVFFFSVAAVAIAIYPIVLSTKSSSMQHHPELDRSGMPGKEQDDNIVDKSSSPTPAPSRSSNLSLDDYGVPANSPPSCENGYTQHPIDDVDELQCGLFASAFEYSNGGLDALPTTVTQFLLLTDVAAQCPCSLENVFLVDGTNEQQKQQSVQVCGSATTHGLEAYRAYCKATFASAVQDIVTLQTLQRDLAFAKFAKVTADIEANKAFLSAQEFQAQTTAAMNELEQALSSANAIDGNPCLDGCALFVRDACCQDSNGQ